MKRLIFITMFCILWISSFSQVIDLSEYNFNKPDPDFLCKVINKALDEGNNLNSNLSSVCFNMHGYDSKKKDNFWHEYILNCRIEIGEGQTLNVPTGMIIKLEGDGGFFLSGNGSIKGDNYTRSVIHNNTDAPAIIFGGDYKSNVDDPHCNNCLVSDIKIQGKADGILINEGSELNEVTSVFFQDLENGIINKGNCNQFNDLAFFKVAASRDCKPQTDDGAAIKIVNSDGNTFTNINHTRSPGAVSLWLNGVCVGNKVLNLSVEQEQSHCGALDPAIYVDRGRSSRLNYIVSNFNGAWFFIDEEADPDDAAADINGPSDFENRNIITPWRVDAIVDLSACGVASCGDSDDGK
ncbi:hypothetical protein N9L92_02300 [Saprospiraceae bacterium]|nr:hypothetical protein [Saprospiraceae bacterium]